MTPLQTVGGIAAPPRKKNGRALLIEQDTAQPMWAHCATCGATGRSALLALWLLAGGWQPRRSVAELRRLARYRGLTMTRSGATIRLARRHELLDLLGMAPEVSRG